MDRSETRAHGNGAASEDHETVSCPALAKTGLERGTQIESYLDDWSELGRATRLLLQSHSKCRTRIERKPPVKVFVDVLWLTILRGVKQGQQCSVLCSRASPKLFPRTWNERAT